MLMSLHDRCDSRAWPGRLAAVFSGLALCLSLAACNGDDAPASTPDVDVPVPPPDPAPKAAFSAAATGEAFTPVTFDASTSTSSDGSALQYVWDFGDGQRGSGAKTAHAFATAGSWTVTLTVVDGAGKRATQSHGMTVTAPAAAGSVAVHVAIVGLDKAAVDGVTITTPGTAAALATTDPQGKADVTLDRGRPLALRLSKSGYADQVRQVKLPEGTGSDARLDIVLSPRDASQPLADAHAGGSLTGRAGASIELPADALVDGSGALVAGSVDIAMTAVDPTLPGGGGFPGRFDGIHADGSGTPIVSLGAVEFILSQGSQRLQLAPGKKATIEIPIQATQRLDGSIVAAGDTTPLWSLDEATGLWVEEGSGTVVANTGSPSGLALRATVAHLSWWNSDLGFDPYGPKPKCIADGDIGIPGAIDAFNAATICNMLAEIDRDLNGGNASASGRAKALAARAAAALSPRVAGFSSFAVLPRTGGEHIAVPANVDIVLNASALNGTWAGKAVVKGPVGVQEDVIVKLRPIAAAGPTTEAITMPVDITRVVTPGTTARFTFTAAQAQYAHLTVGPSAGALVAGSVRLLQGDTVLGTRDYANADVQLTAPLAAGGSYTIEIDSVTQAGGVRLRGEVLGGLQAETLSLPADVTRSLPSYTTYQGGLDVAAPGGLHLAYQRTAGSPTALSLKGPDGSVLWTQAGTNLEMSDLLLPAAGHYTLSALSSDGTASSFRLTGDAIDWLPLGAAGQTDSSFSIIDLVADRNGKPVVGFGRSTAVNGHTTQVLQLRRWTGSAWEDVGGPVNIDKPCGNAAAAGFAFDGTNTPTIVYMSQTGTSAGEGATAVRLANGSWQPLGNNNGVLPGADAYTNGCDAAYAPRLVFDTNDQPVVAYRMSAALWVQRLANGAWGKLAATAQDSFPVNYGAFDLKADPAGVPWLVQVADGPTRVRRFDAASGTWLATGGNQGVLPESGTSGFSVPRLAFDTAGRPMVAGVIAVGVGTSSAGTIVYRYDGTTWNSTGARQLPNSYVNNTPVAGVAALGNDVLVAFSNQDRTAGAALVVQRDTAAAWSAFGRGANGALTQYVAHGITPERPALDPRLLVVGNEIYLVATVRTPSSTGAPASIDAVLHRYVGAR